MSDPHQVMFPLNREVKPYPETSRRHSPTPIDQNSNMWLTLVQGRMESEHSSKHIATQLRVCQQGRRKWILSGQSILSAIVLVNDSSMFQALQRVLYMSYFIYTSHFTQ